MDGLGNLNDIGAEKKAIGDLKDGIFCFPIIYSNVSGSK